MKNLMHLLGKANGKRFSDEYKITSCRRVYRNIHFAGNASCNYCPPNGGCNNKGKYFWKVTEMSNSNFKVGNVNLMERYPNWKLVSKSGKQWQDKGIYYKVENHIDPDIVSIRFMSSSFSFNRGRWA